MESFVETGLNELIIKAISEMGFKKPTPIQAKAIPHLLSSDQDLIALAQTGTGKTAAFGLPALHKIRTSDRNTQTIVLCPTRELCLQIVKDLQAYAKYLKSVNIVAVYGGSSIEKQIKALKRGAQIVVGTPGRTRDLIKRKKLVLGAVERVILDEADEMLTMGFKEELDAILAATPEEKQSLLFSATMSRDILSVTKTYMSDAVQISVATRNKATENVQHFYYMAHSRDHYEVLKRIADHHPDIYGIVFCRTRRETKEISNKLMQDQYNADALHGDLSQAQRDEVMDKFRQGHLQLLIATDVAARGLDVNNLSHVINMNLPDQLESYVHRSGRTGRAGNSGVSMAIIHTREGRRLRDIERHAGITFTKGSIPTGKEICRKQLFSLIDKVEKVAIDETQIAPFLPEVYKKLEWLDREQLIKHFVSVEFNRFLEYYKNDRDLNIKASKQKERRSVSDRRKTPYSRLYLNVGSKRGLNPKRLIGLINHGLDSGNVAIGKIEILKKFSFFEIEEKAADALIDALRGKEFEGISLLAERSPEKRRSKDQRGKPKRNHFDKKRGGKKNKRRR